MTSVHPWKIWPSRLSGCEPCGCLKYRRDCWASWIYVTGIREGSLHIDRCEDTQVWKAQHANKLTNTIVDWSCIRYQHWTVFLKLWKWKCICFKNTSAQRMNQNQASFSGRAFSIKRSAMKSFLFWGKNDMRGLGNTGRNVWNDQKPFRCHRPGLTNTSAGLVITNTDM